MKKIFIAISNHNDEQVCKQIANVNKEEITNILSQIHPSLCPYTKQVKLDVALKIRQPEDTFPKITRTFIYKEEEYNSLKIHTIAFPDITTRQHYVKYYNSFHTLANAMYAMRDIIHAFLEEEQKCKEPDDLPY